MQIIVLTFAKLQGCVSISRVCALQCAHNNKCRSRFMRNSVSMASELEIIKNGCQNAPV